MRTDRYNMAAQALLYGGKPRQPIASPRTAARLVGHHLEAGVVVADIDDDGTRRVLRLETADHPELQRLGADDRSKLHAAVLTLHRGGPPDAA